MQTEMTLGVGWQARVRDWKRWENINNSKYSYKLNDDVYIYHEENTATLDQDICAPSARKESHVTI